MSKAEIQAAEGKQQEVEDRRKHTGLQVDRSKALVIDGKRAKARAGEELKLAQAETSRLQSVLGETRQAAEECRRQREALARELADSDRQLEEEQAALRMARAARGGLQQAQDWLGSVREELAALSSEAAKRVALEAEGGELPTDVVPAPSVCKAELPVDPQALWSEDSAHPLGQDVRQALQSHLVLVALQRSLAVRASELREGLRQLGFARSAARRTEELCQLSAGDQKNNTIKVSELHAETQKTVAERDDELGSLAKFQADHKDLQLRHEALSGQLESSTGATADLAEERRSMVRTLEAAKVAHEELRREHEETGFELEVRQNALNEHPQEAQRRRGAAAKLAQMADYQRQKGLDQLQQSQAELMSFQQARATLKEAHAVLGEQLEAHQKAKVRVKAEQEQLNLDLSALARNYMAVLPPLPGLGKLADEPEPVTPAPGPAEPVQGQEAEKGAFGRTPEPPQKALHADPTGHGVLTAGGRLVLSI